MSLNRRMRAVLLSEQTLGATYRHEVAMLEELA